VLAGKIVNPVRRNVSVKTVKWMDIIAANVTNCTFILFVGIVSNKMTALGTAKCANLAKIGANGIVKIVIGVRMVLPCLVTTVGQHRLVRSGFDERKTEVKWYFHQSD